MRETWQFEIPELVDKFDIVTTAIYENDSKNEYDKKLNCSLVAYYALLYYALAEYSIFSINFTPLQVNFQNIQDMSKNIDPNLWKLVVQKHHTQLE